MVADPLKEQLRRLVRALEPEGISLIVGGGYGLLLRTEEIRRSGVRTRLENPPRARSTADIDIFLGAEIITDRQKTRAIRAALDNLGYTAIEGAKFYQFVLLIERAGFSRGIKIDLLAAPVTGTRSKVKQDDRRIRPHGFSGLHAHLTPEAFSVEDNAVPVNIGDDDGPLTVYLPHPFSYLILKLFALKDRFDDNLKGPYHAFDIYRTVAMMTAQEWDQAVAMRDRHRANGIFKEASELSRTLFSTTTSPGVLRLQQHARSAGEDIPGENLDELIRDLNELIAGS